jgi:hypothetical protein
MNHSTSTLEAISGLTPGPAIRLPNARQLVSQYLALSQGRWDRFCDVHTASAFCCGQEITGCPCTQFEMPHNKYLKQNINLGV